MQMHPVSAGLGRDLVVVLRSLILTGDIKPGEKILPKDLQVRFGVSHIPLREALRALETEGLIVTVPRRGTTAAQVSLTELREVYALRRLLEPPLMAQAVLVRTDAHVATAQAARRQLAAESAADTDAWLSSHHAFHRALLQPAVLGVGTRLLDQLGTLAERYVRMSVASLGAATLSSHDHDVLLDSFVEQDADLARREALHHLELVESSVTSALGDLH